jgi:hypothetical protein
MNRQPADLLAIIEPFAPLFTTRVGWHARVLLIGAILAPGTRAVASVLRIVGLGHERCFHKYHRVLKSCPRVDVARQSPMTGVINRCAGPRRAVGDGPR